MTVTVYRYDDTSAPTLTGSAGALVALLRACLVDGYGEKVGSIPTTKRLPTGTLQPTLSKSHCQKIAGGLSKWSSPSPRK